MMTNRYLWQHLPNKNVVVQVLPAYVHTLPFEQLPKWNESSPKFPAGFEIFQQYLEYKLNLIRYSPGLICIKLGHKIADDETLKNVYTYIAASLGKLNNKYGFLYDVIDHGYDHTKEAIPVSQTNASTSYHTDSTSLSYSPDVVGLLCMQPALSGGTSLVGNAANLAHFMQKNYPRHYQFLQHPIIRDIITPGVKKTKEMILENSFPVFSIDENRLFKFRYMRYWIESGHKKTGTDMNKMLIEAMDIIDHYFSDEHNVFSIDLERGDILFINNNFLAHNRTSFIDAKANDKKRLLLRTWINW